MSFTSSLSDLVTANRNGLLGSAKGRWTRVPLGSVAEVQNGYPFPSSGFSTTVGMPLIRIRDISSDATEVYFRGAYDEAFVVEPGDLLVGMDGDFNARLWRGPRGLLNQRVCRILPDQRVVDQRFLAYVLPGYLSAINAETSSVTVKHLSSKTVKEIPLPLPSLAEQRRLVAALDEHLSGLSAAIASLSRAQRNIARYTAAVRSDAVTGNLGRSCDERRLPVADLGEEYPLPHGWEWATIADVCEKIDNGNTPPAEKMYSGQGEIPFVKVYNLTKTGRLDFSVRPTFIDRSTHEGPLRRSRLLPGDVLMNIVGPPLGKVSIVPDTHAEWNTNQAVVAFRVAPRLSSRYLAVALMAEPVIKRLTSKARATAGQHNISLTMCRSLRMPLPPLAEQLRIVDEVDRRMALTDRLSAQLATQLARAERLGRSVLRHAIEGELVSCGSDTELAASLLKAAEGVQPIPVARFCSSPQRR